MEFTYRCGCTLSDATGNLTVKPCIAHMPAVNQLSPRVQADATAPRKPDMIHATPTDHMQAGLMLGTVGNIFETKYSAYEQWLRICKELRVAKFEVMNARTEADVALLRIQWQRLCRMLGTTLEDRGLKEQMNALERAVMHFVGCEEYIAEETPSPSSSREGDRDVLTPTVTQLCDPVINSHEDAIRLERAIAEGSIHKDRMLKVQEALEVFHAQEQAKHAAANSYPNEADHLAIVSRVSIQSLRCENWRSISRQTPFGLQVQVLTEIFCIKDGHRKTLESDWRQINRDAPEDRVVRVLRDAAVAMLTHELEEAFTYKGRRVFDPHTLK